MQGSDEMLINNFFEHDGIHDVCIFGAQSAHQPLPLIAHQSIVSFLDGK